MNFRTTETSSTAWSGDCLVLGLFEDAMEMTGDLAALDQRLSGTLTELIAETEFKGQAGSSAITRVGGDSPVRKVGLVGLGAAADYQGETLRQGAAASARLAKREKCKTLGLAFPKLDAGDGASVQTMTEGVSLALHQDQRFKSETNGDTFTPGQVEILATSPQEEAIDHAKKICAGVILARELVAAPPNVVTPMALADTAADIAAESGMELEVLEREACEALGMGSFLGVAQASDMPPKFIHLTYKPKGTPRRKLAIVGKGLTFDSGGLNLKVGGSGIEMMKTDMGGAAATFGAAKAIGLLQPDVEVHFISAATENMISGHAIHPGDILTASNGKTIEVNNTDAEGRLTLADALVFAEKLEVDAIVDLATLTGACIVALGEEMAGLWSPDTALAAELETAAKTAGESLWQMPMESKYFDGLKSIVADMKNTGPRAGGSITAALFLQQFIKETAWAHLDVAGPVWTEKEQGYNNPGGTGYGVRTLVNWVLA